MGVGVGQLAEVAAEADLAGVVERLAPEEHHPVAQQGVADGGDGGVVEGPGDVEAVDLGADLAGDGPDVEERSSRAGRSWVRILRGRWAQALLTNAISFVNNAVNPFGPTTLGDTPMRRPRPPTARGIPARPPPPRSAAACGGDDGGEAAAGSAGADTGAGRRDIPPGITLRVGEQSPTGELAFELGGFNDDLPYRIEYVRFNSGPLTNEGFAAGAIDIGSMGDNPAIGAAARDLPVTVLGLTTSDGPGSILVARPESGIEIARGPRGQAGRLHHRHRPARARPPGARLGGADPGRRQQVDVPLQDLPSVLESGDADVSVISYEAEVKYKRAHPDAMRLTTAADLPGAGSYHLVADAALDDPGNAAAVYDYLERRIAGPAVDHRPPRHLARGVLRQGAPPDPRGRRRRDRGHRHHHVRADHPRDPGGPPGPRRPAARGRRPRRRRSTSRRIYDPDSIARFNEVLARVTG